MEGGTEGGREDGRCGALDEPHGCDRGDVACASEGKVDAIHSRRQDARPLDPLVGLGRFQSTHHPKGILTLWKMNCQKGSIEFKRGLSRHGRF